VLRAITREPDAAAALLDDLSRDAGDDARLRIEFDSLRRMLTSNEPLEALGRQLAERLVLLAQACLLRRHAPTPVAEAFLATRLDPRWGRIVGTFGTSGLDVTALLARAL
jgi:putative acyl-CoA dehydrogenase